MSVVQMLPRGPHPIPRHPMETMLESSATKDKVVPCKGCTACCRGPGRTLVLDRKDRIIKYSTYKGTRVVRNKMNGDCIYLTDKGCSIWADRPIPCRQFDCLVVFDYPPHHPDIPEHVRIAAAARRER